MCGTILQHLSFSVAIVQGEGKIEVILEAQKKKKVHFVALMDNAVFTEQGSSASASQMTAARVMDVIARPLDCTGQTADAVSANTQVKMEDAPKLLKITKSDCPEIWTRLPRHKWLKSWSNIVDPLVLQTKFVRTRTCRPLV